MIGVPAGTRIWIAAGVTDLRRGFTGLSGMVQTALKENPFSGHVFVFRGRRGDLIKMLWWNGDGLCLFAKRIERGKFTWPQATSGTVALTPAQLSMLLEGIDWRLSFAKTPRQPNFILTCYTASLYVVDFKCVPNFDETQPYFGIFFLTLRRLGDRLSRTVVQMAACPPPL
jgi:transposase